MNGFITLNQSKLSIMQMSYILIVTSTMEHPYYRAVVELEFIS